MDITAASAEQVQAEVRAAYPFHPAIRDLYARFKENAGFQQTRALIRLMRLIVADLWDSGVAREQYLIGAHDIDFHQQDVLSEIRQINPSLESAIAHDIASEGRGAVAEQIDRGETTDAEDVARLVFLSSLSQAVNPTLGLDRSEIVRYLAAPGRDLAGLNTAIDRLQAEAWYLHATRDGKLLFKNTENLVAKLDTYTRGKLREQREGELRDRLKEMFQPKLGICY
jgi:predicted AAA+ superfamily ATPase